MSKNLIDTLIFSFLILFTLIGIHQAMTVGFAASYVFFMLALCLLFIYQARKKKEEDPKKPVTSKGKGSKPKMKKK